MLHNQNLKIIKNFLSSFYIHHLLLLFVFILYDISFRSHFLCLFIILWAKAQPKEDY
jgi:hypothetical protein